MYLSQCSCILRMFEWAANAAYYILSCARPDNVRPDNFSASEDLLVLQSTSVPIAIPVHLMRKDSPAGSLGSPTETFVPPHLAVRSTQKQHVAESLPVTTSAQIRTRNRVFQSTGFLPQGTSLQQGFLVSRASTQPHIPEHSTELGTDELMHFNPPDLSPPASRAYTRRMSLPAQPSAQKHMPAALHAQRSYRLHLR